MVAPNPRSLGDSFPDDSFPDSRSLREEDGTEQESEERDESPRDADDVRDASGQDFQNPMTEEDTASGGPADPA
ncbi:hypothetical protein JD276_09900 [Leucobacter sp. CSA1]|uniref:Uncharacterized protein n=1 Tax=Leucobacter chromiisoli TaxID=2796471 RepID=A0A934QA55_9MICO|nr:hypothetical protein [Leucobacter chromiisoli]MBK0419347.1 hypothetical protein [Leucobacter chromiisoli]